MDFKTTIFLFALFALFIAMVTVDWYFNWDEDLEDFDKKDG